MSSIAIEPLLALHPEGQRLLDRPGHLPSLARAYGMRCKVVSASFGPEGGLLVGSDGTLVRLAPPDPRSDHRLVIVFDENGPTLNRQLHLDGWQHDCLSLLGGCVVARLEQTGGLRWAAATAHHEAWVAACAGETIHVHDARQIRVGERSLGDAIATDAPATGVSWSTVLGIVAAHQGGAVAHVSRDGWRVLTSHATPLRGVLDREGLATLVFNDGATQRFGLDH